MLTQSTTAVANTVPAGGAIAVGLTYTMLSSWGFSKSRSTLSILVTGIWNNFVKLGTPILALALLALQGQPGGGRLVARGDRPRRAGRRPSCSSRSILAQEPFAVKLGLDDPALGVEAAAPFKRGPVDRVGPRRDQVPQPGHRPGPSAAGCP